MRATYRHPRATGYRAPGGPWDVPTLDRLLPPDPVADAVAGGLRAAGVRRGDVVAWQLPNRPEAVTLYRACWRLGAIAAPLHHRAGAAEVARMLAGLDPALVVDPEAPLPVGPPVTHSSARPFDLAVVLFTAGSSGEPKAVLHTHRGLAYKARTMVRAHGLQRGDVVLMPAPLAHISGLLNGVLVPGTARMRAVLMERWDPEQALRLIQRERVSFMVGPPTFFLGLVHAPGLTAARVRTLRLVSCGGAGVTPAFVDEASERLGARVKRSYGSTEAPTLTTSTAADPRARARDTDGRAVGGCLLRLAADGELLVQGPELFAGYADPAQTPAAVVRGWFRTGDVATLEDGWLTIVGRKKDLIIRGGENISPAEVEHVLEQHPAIRHAAAVGYADERLGERVCAFVVGGPFTLEDCRAFFADRGVARFKIPERIVHLDELPVLAAGKVDRGVLRALAARSSP